MLRTIELWHRTGTLLMTTVLVDGSGNYVTIDRRRSVCSYQISTVAPLIVLCKARSERCKQVSRDKILALKGVFTHSGL